MAYLAAGVNLALLFIFKYLSFTTELLSPLFPGVIPVELPLPVGISFYTFQGLSYVLDVYRGDVPPERHLSNTALYISLFPQLVAGPIVRYKTIAQEIRGRKESLEGAAEGALRFLFGLAKKVLLANQMGLAADAVFSQTHPSVLTAWLGVIAYAFQIYFDFSGYSDMAIGLGRIFGFHFPENFNYPYAARSITEFWRRWHISLGAWFRDYVYIPLGGNRLTKGKHIRNILVVWVLTGIWHGAAWTFLLWGVYYALLLLGEKFCYGKVLQKLSRPLQHLYALFFILCGWVIFRAADMAQVLRLFSILLGGARLWDGQAVYLLLQYRWELLMSVLLAFPLPRLFKNLPQRKAGEMLLLWGRPAAALGLFGVSVIRLISSGFNPFLYFQF